MDVMELDDSIGTFTELINGLGLIWQWYFYRNPRK